MQRIIECVEAREKYEGKRLIGAEEGWAVKGSL
jgi:hypothetical protein